MGKMDSVFWSKVVAAIAGVVAVLPVAVGRSEVQAVPRGDWTGEGSFRLLVKVDPMELSGRMRDEGPAEVEIDFVSLLRESGLEGKADIASVQVMRVDRATRQPVVGGDYAFARSVYDRPFRWYDAAIPYDFPEFMGSISATKSPRPKNRVRSGYFYNVVGDWERGRLAWTHTQEGEDFSLYYIYFDRLDRSAEVNEAPPRGWIGDGMARFDETGSGTTGVGHTRVAVTDWNGNGLPDIVYGESYGKLFVMPNRGDANQPAYPVHRMIFDAEDLPIDVGMSSAPLLVDWTGNGVEDLLVGSHWNVIAFFRNIGSNTERRYRFEGLVELDGQPLEVPWEPVVGRPAGAFIRDYYPVMEAVDWTGNGELDLLVGGYVTGRIFLYENTGRGENGLPVLVDRGPLRDAAGEIINVGDWCAAPTVADFTGNGVPDLITGNLPMTPGSLAAGRPLRFFENVGKIGAPSLVEREFPAEGRMPALRLSSPRAVDWNGDGLFDLVVSSASNIYLFENIGTVNAPKFRVDRGPISSKWGLSQIPAQQFIDWNGNGLPDAVSGYTVHLNSGKGNPYHFDARVNVLPPGERIAHPSDIGDDWFWPRLYDFNGNGRYDVLFGDWWGHVRLHRNFTSNGEVRFDLEGELLATIDGLPIKVGPIDEPKDSFRALQGARTVFGAADFTGNGLTDLAVGDTYGVVRFFENVGTVEKPVFAPPVVVGDLGQRLLIDAADWNGDGWSDIVAGGANGRVEVFLNTGEAGEKRFAAGFDPALPPLVQPRIVMVDLNRDGDEDLFVPSPQGSVWVERSFLRNGYAAGEIMGLERRAGAR
jgi:hypothetical protein